MHAAESLFTRYRDQIYRFCYARLRSREEAEDATQNVFMRVHMALQRGVVPEYEAAWLYKIAHNVCLSKGESNTRRARIETPHAFDEDDEVQIAAREVSSDELAGLSEALEAMPPKMRTAIVLREWQGLSYAEIAEAMGLTVPAVETLLFRSRRHLAAALEQGAPQPKRKLAGFFTLPTFLRRLFMGAAPAKLAAGAAMVALTGGGIGLGVAVADHPAHGRPALPVPQQITYLAGTGGAAGAPARIQGVAVSVAIPAPLRGRHAAPASSPAPAAPAPTREPAIAAVVPAVAPVAEPRQSEPAAGPLPATPTVQVTTSASATVSTPVATTTVSAQVPTVPTVSTPTVSTPSVDVPTVGVPTASLPVTVAAPGLTLP